MIDVEDGYGVLTEPMTLKIERLLPAPAERVWAYLTDSELRRRWFAAGPMELKPGGRAEFVWRNDELSPPRDDPRPEEFDEEHRLETQILACDPPRSLTFRWGDGSEVTWDVEPRGAQALLTITHRRVSTPAMLRGVSSGWHLHLDVLATELAGRPPLAFWRTLQGLRAEYERRLA